jgi:cytochrome P450
VHLSGFGGVVFSEYDTSRAILRDNRFGNGDLSNRRGPFGEGDPELMAFRDKMLEEQSHHAQSMLGLDPPDHTRQRSLVSRAFTPRTVEKLRPRVAELVEVCLDEMAEAETCDVMETIAKPLPVSVISEMLGVPRTDWPEIRETVTDLVAALEPAATVPELELAMDARHVLRDYFTSLIAIRRADPRDDLLSGLIAARDEHDQLSESEILAVAILLFAAGAETTTNLIGNGVNQLLNHPEQMERLWQDPSLVPSAVEEILRFDSPVQLDGRSCLEAGEFAGVHFEEGDRVITLLGAANHDGKHFERPDEFDVTRYAGRNGSGPAEPVMSFGSGIHYCLGANLAKLEGQEVFAGLVRRFSTIEAAGDRPFRHRMVLRGLETCPVAVRSRPGT